MGGHTIIDDEIKYGLSVTGRIDPASMLTNANARPGDRLVLTKPIGNGILATALKQQTLDANAVEAVIALMCELNADGESGGRSTWVLDAQPTSQGSVCSVTSRTSLGRVTSPIQLRIASVPILPRAINAWRSGARPGGGSRNLDYVQHMVDWGPATEVERALLTDPQTSGGLVVAVPPSRLLDYLEKVPRAVEIGEVLPRGRTAIVLG